MGAIKDNPAVAALVLVAAVAWAIMYRPTKVTAPADPLDTVLMFWDKANAFARRHLLAGVVIFGRTGASKTTGSGMTLARAIVADERSSLLILAAKPDDAVMWRRIFAEKGRELLEFSPDGNLRCNMLDFIQSCRGDTREIVDFLMTASEVLRGESKGGGEYGSFFQDEERRYFYHAVEILRQSGVAVSAPNLQRFINGAALSAEQLASEKWREGFHNQCLRTAALKKKNAREQHDFEMARDAWCLGWPVMASRTRSCVLSGMLNSLFFSTAESPGRLSRRQAIAARSTCCMAGSRFWSIARRANTGRPGC